MGPRGGVESVDLETRVIHWLNPGVEMESPVVCDGWKECRWDLCVGCLLFILLFFVSFFFLSLCHYHILLFVHPPHHRDQRLKKTSKQLLLSEGSNYSPWKPNVF